MKSVALVTEYNPFHNGHLYHVQKSKSITDSDISIAIMSGNFVMRGEPAIYNKFIRTEMALHAVDLVVELPAYASLSAGPYFGDTAVQIANYLDADYLSFGSESGDIDSFLELSSEMSRIEKTPAFAQKVKEGKSYPRIISELLTNNLLLSSPNNTLGISYINAIRKHDFTIKPITIQRNQANHHDNSIQNLQFASGTSIRNAILQKNNQWHDVVPKSNHPLFHPNITTTEDTFNYIKYALTTKNVSELKQIYTMSEGLEYRLKDYISQATSFETYMQLIKTKRYTYTHLQRVLMNILLNFTYENLPTKINAVRILGMNKQGQNYLKYLKLKYPERHFVTQINKRNASDFKNEILSTNVYNLLSNDVTTDFNTHVIRKN
ncbi:nucleotidyltransferase [Staphylococcus sp. ACRSN]|uniref:nucleotidyltransferase n=1 Tax=Staphylococcus sp. ACRSN TaxID=2918214 RepID=UPI001EF2535B|nr:nucleotidyltransferase [Staphylococcus sp. ACRSN]MCG7338755.1 nucleotidyltransferase [Staphylococcus sp. ACRSN]